MKTIIVLLPLIINGGNNKRNIKQIRDSLIPLLGELNTEWHYTNALIFNGELSTDVKEKIYRRLIVRDCSVLYVTTENDPYNNNKNPNYWDIS
ncbi:MAG: hypothetical protein J6A25_05875 [Lachnospiraceae bacterium]|nr:hypothetical protein [Lachnospiraceae bacterium]